MDREPDSPLHSNLKSTEINRRFGNEPESFKFLNKLSSRFWFIFHHLRSAVALGTQRAIN